MNKDITDNNDDEFNNPILCFLAHFRENDMLTVNNQTRKDNTVKNMLLSLSLCTRENDRAKSGGMPMK
jgi:hypothetical protein